MHGTLGCELCPTEAEANNSLDVLPLRCTIVPCNYTMLNVHASLIVARHHSDEWAWHVGIAGEGCAGMPLRGVGALGALAFECICTCMGTH